MSQKQSQSIAKHTFQSTLRGKAQTKLRTWRVAAAGMFRWYFHVFPLFLLALIVRMCSDIINHHVVFRLMRDPRFFFPLRVLKMPNFLLVSQPGWTMTSGFSNLRPQRSQRQPCVNKQKGLVNVLEFRLLTVATFHNIWKQKSKSQWTRFFPKLPKHLLMFELLLLFPVPVFKSTASTAQLLLLACFKTTWYEVVHVPRPSPVRHPSGPGPSKIRKVHAKKFQRAKWQEVELSQHSCVTCLQQCLLLRLIISMCNGHSSSMILGILVQSIRGEDIVLLTLLKAGFPGRRILLNLLLTATVSQSKENWWDEWLQKEFVQPQDDVVHAEDQKDAKNEPRSLAGHVHHSGFIVLPLQIWLQPLGSRKVCSCRRVVVLLAKFCGFNITTVQHCECVGRSTSRHKNAKCVEVEIYVHNICVFLRSFHV